MRYDKRKQSKNEWKNVDTDRITCGECWVAWRREEPFENVDINKYIKQWVKPALIALKNKLNEIQQSNKAVHIDQKGCE